ncbi:MAG: hypothetical protein WCY32_14820, partial [Burkholderiaceae bacterium]
MTAAVPISAMLCEQVAPQGQRINAGQGNQGPRIGDDNASAHAAGFDSQLRARQSLQTQRHYETETLPTPHAQRADRAHPAAPDQPAMPAGD